MASSIIFWWLQPNDGNNVSLDRESRLLAENALRFNVATNLLRNELRTVRKAIEEGKGA